jgi:hypothetical protein
MATKEIVLKLIAAVKRAKGKRDVVIVDAQASYDKAVKEAVEEFKLAGGDEEDMRLDQS